MQKIIKAASLLALLSCSAMASAQTSTNCGSSGVITVVGSGSASGTSNCTNGVTTTTGGTTGGGTIVWTPAIPSGPVVTNPAPVAPLPVMPRCFTIAGKTFCMP